MKDIIDTRYGHCNYCVCENDDCSMIYNLFVKEYRRKGNGKKLINSAINEIRKTGYTGDIKIIAEPEGQSISKEDLINFYKKMDDVSKILLTLMIIAVICIVIYSDKGEKI